MAIANDIRPFSAPRWVEVLIQADERFGSAQPANPDYTAGVQELRSWNCELAADSRAALKYAYWRIQLIEDLGGGRMRSLAERVDSLREPLGEARKPLSLSDEELRQAASSFAKAMARLRSDFGTLEKTYGEVFRVGRGDRSWPCEGGMGERLGLTTLRSVGYGAERPDHTRWARERADLHRDRGPHQTDPKLDLCAAGPERPARFRPLSRSGREGLQPAKNEVDLVDPGGAGRAHRVPHRDRRPIAGSGRRIAPPLMPNRRACARRRHGLLGGRYEAVDRAARHGGVPGPDLRHLVAAVAALGRAPADARHGANPLLVRGPAGGAAKPRVLRHADRDHAGERHLRGVVAWALDDRHQGHRPAGQPVVAAQLFQFRLHPPALTGRLLR